MRFWNLTQPGFKWRKQRGFTLVEVLVALVVAAVALAALSRTLGLSVANQSSLESKIVATWVAQDALLQRQMFPNQSLANTVEMMGRKWQVSVDIAPTMVPNFQQLRVNVRSQQTGAESIDASLASIVSGAQ